MTFRLVYLAIWALALSVVFVSIVTGDLSRRIAFSSLNRYELFILFLYFSTVYTVIKSADEIKRTKVKEPAGEDELIPATLSFDEKLLILPPSIAVLLFVFMTA